MTTVADSCVRAKTDLPWQSKPECPRNLKPERLKLYFPGECCDSKRRPLSCQVSSLKAERRRLNNELEDARNQVDDLERQKKKLAAELAKV
jgi:hypothetical protein